MRAGSGKRNANFSAFIAGQIILLRFDFAAQGHESRALLHLPRAPARIVCGE
jgi:hypothetical protein